MVALVAAMVALLLVYGASPTHAAGSCSTTSGTTTCTFSPTGAEDTFVVPAGVSTIHVVATGAPGAVAQNGGTAGRGARVSTDLAVSPGQTLYVNVGGTPTGSGGGFNGGGSSFNGGGGGGASDVRFVSRDQNNTLSSRLIVAAGGGGSGQGQGGVFCDDLPPETGTVLGGAGGNAGSDGGAAQNLSSGTGDCFPVEGTEGGAGTQTGGGAAGTPGGGNGGTPGQSGSLGLGGNGAGGGGGGGGGFFGGGGGADLHNPYDPETLTTAAGGGGGSNLVFGSGIVTISNSAPSVTISYQGGLGEEPPTEPENKQACKKGGWKELGFKNQGACIKAVNPPS